MRVINRPRHDFKLVYNLCINSIGNSSLVDRFKIITNFIVKNAKLYDRKANIAGLFRIPENNCKNNQVVISSITKKELKNLYDQQMVGQSKPARTIYDKLIISAPNGICPYCGFGHATTLDHYLPKTSFPCFSVLPINLVPSCKDCNTGSKRNKTANTAEQQSIHPYYDHQLIEDKRWLFAEVKKTSPASIRFFVTPPSDWNEIMKQRVKSHFNDFDLSKRYSVQAANELATLKPILTSYFSSIGKHLIKTHLKLTADSEYSNHKNSWKTAMYYALDSSDWYCNGGFK